MQLINSEPSPLNHYTDQHLPFAGSECDGVLAQPIYHTPCQHQQNTAYCESCTSTHLNVLTRAEMSASSWWTFISNWPPTGVRLRERVEDAKLQVPHCFVTATTLLSIAIPVILCKLMYYRIAGEFFGGCQICDIHDKFWCHKTFHRQNLILTVFVIKLTWFVGHKI